MRGDEFVREVDEAVRQDRWATLWKRYGAFLIGGVLAIVLGAGGGMAWREYQRSARLSEADQYAAAVQLLQQNQPAEAAEAFALLADDADSGYAVLARLRAAEARALAGEREAKLETLQQLAQDDDLTPMYRDLSRLLAAQLQLDQGEAEAVAGELDELTGADQPWNHVALELKALVQMRTGDHTAARRTLTGLASDPATPVNLARRSAELLTALGGPVAEEPAEEGAGQAPEADRGADQEDAP